MADAHEHGDPFAEQNRRLQEIIDGLPDVASSDFWPALQAYGNDLPPEVLVHVCRECIRHGRQDDLDRAYNMLILRSYGIAQAIVRRHLPASAADHEDAIRDAFRRMWEYILADRPFWERNFVGAFEAACLSACRFYRRTMIRATPFSALHHPVDDERGDLDPADKTAARAQRSLEDRLTIERIAVSLTPEERTVAHLAYIEGLSRKEIAARLGCDAKTVYNRLNRARDKFAAFMTERGKHNEP